MKFNNERKELRVPTINLTRAWLSLIRVLSELTEREVDVLEVLINKRSELITSGIKQPYLSQLLFSTESRKLFCTTIGITEYNLTNLLSSLRKKGAIQKIKDNEDIYPDLLPAKEVLIKFIIDDKGTGDSQEDS